jgi:hypothetical protein
VLSYDTSILTAIDYGFHSPFTNPLPSQINDTAGYVALSASTYMGDPNGMNATNAVPVARILFLVDARGSTLLDIHNSSLPNIYAEWLPHEVADGFFANINTKVPDLAPTNASPPQAASGSLPRRGDILSGQQLNFHAGLKMNENSSTKGLSGYLHVYKNRLIDPVLDRLSFWISVYRTNATHTEWLQVGYYQKNSQFTLYTETVLRTDPNQPTDIQDSSQTHALANHYLEIVETSNPEEFQAKIDGQIARTYRFRITSQAATTKEYQAMGENRFGYGYLRGHMWDLKWYDSSGASHSWEAPARIVEESPPLGYYDVLNLTSRPDVFYTTGYGYDALGSKVFQGDVNGDGTVDVTDGAEISARWTKPGPGSPLGPLGYDSNSDISPEMASPPAFPDEKVMVAEGSIVSAYWTGPPKGPSAP